MGIEIDYSKLEEYLRGDVSLEDLDTRRFNLFDATVIAYTLAIPHLDELTYRVNEEIRPKDALTRMLSKYCPYGVYNSHTDASRKLGLHRASARSRGSALTLPTRLIELVNQYKDLPEGGIAKFAALKEAQSRGNSREDEILPENIAQDVVLRLRRCYGEEVLDIIRQTL